MGLHIGSAELLLQTSLCLRSTEQRRQTKQIENKSQKSCIAIAQIVSIHFGIELLVDSKTTFVFSDLYVLY